MTPEQISLVRHSRRPLTAHAAEAGAFFYDRLFSLDPSLRAFFPADLRKHGRSSSRPLAP